MNEIPNCLQQILNDYGKLERDCLFFSMIDNFYKLHKRMHQCGPEEKRILRKSMDKMSEKIIKLSGQLECFPTMCFDCPGKKRCLNCKKQMQCTEILLELKKIPPV